MCQRNIKNYFSANRKGQTVLTKSESDSDESVDTEINISQYADVSQYEDLFKKKNEFKNLAKVVVNEGGISLCWKYFGDLYFKKRHILQKYKFCKLCLDEKTNLKSFGKSTSTTNYMNHLRAVHNLDVKSLNNLKSSTMTQNALKSSTSCNNKQQNARRVAEMCCWDLQPFKIVERPGFKKLVSFLNPKAIFPTDRTIATTALNDVYNIYLDHVKTSLKESPENVTLVLDMWSDKHKHLSYINIKVHFCQNFQMQIVTLKTEIFPRPHTGLAVVEKIEEALCEFNLLEKNICAVTDGGSNIVSALKIKNIPRYGCMAHVLHRFLMEDILNNKSFENINNIISKLKKIYGSLMYSYEEISNIQNMEEQNDLVKIFTEVEIILESLDSCEQFPHGDDYFTEQYEATLNVKHHTSLKNSVATRWNSLLAMIQSYTNNISTINIALVKAKKELLVIGTMEMQIITEFGTFLKIFEDATKHLQGQDYPTISSCIYFQESIMSSLKKEEEKASFELTINLCNFAVQNFTKRFKVYRMYVVAALMDPCQKNWPVLDKYILQIPKQSPNSLELVHDVLSPISKENLIMEEIEKLKEIDDTLLNEPSTSTEPNAKKQKISASRQRMLEFMGPSPSNVQNNVELEIRKYLEMKVEAVEPLDWWRQNKQIFPNVAAVANMCFGIPATSASSEQAFSYAGNCVNAKRSSLHPATVKKQLFVHDNKAVVEPFLSN
ncbi:zinc finger BED domain-containing protein 4-like [Musca vetustissima]|uniref:zinc finger BED domain-containing protein 4-like n=1 Tax=Musca vetustissima TaxID=27455 RepID=UPI002AB6292D|nr:zinc finger BED domain-containing protein 4-like [Musca vetustissima]